LPRWRSEGEHVHVGPGSGEAPGDGKFAMEAMDEAMALLSSMIYLLIVMEF